MSTLPDFTGPGFFAGEAPDGLTTIAGTPTSAQVRVYWRDPADSQASDVLVASTQSAADGTWQIAGLNPALRYVVRAQKSQFDDVTVVGAAPSRSDVIAYVDQLVPREDEFGDVDGLTGYVLLDSGLPPFACEVMQPLPYGLSARIEGRKLLIEGVSSDNGLWESVVRVTASNGPWVDVAVQVEIQVLPRDPHFDKVLLLLHMDGVAGSKNFIDSSSVQKNILSIGDAKISTDKWMWGGASGAFNGSGDMLYVANRSAFNFGIEDFTIEAWVYPTSFTGSSQAATIFSSYGGPFDGRYLLRLVNYGKVNFYVHGTASGGLASSKALLLGKWAHIAVTRSGNIFRIFIDGVMSASASITNALSADTNHDPVIGGYWQQTVIESLGYFAGYIDDLRVTKGVARYISDFALPDEPFLDR